MQIKKYRNLFFYKNKKGIEISLSELMMALLAVAIILILFYVGGKLISIFVSEKDYDSTIASFDLLGERVDSLIEDKNYANTNFLYYLKATKLIPTPDYGYILVGFNYKDSSVQIKTCKDEPLLESRKKISGLCDKACLCIYKDTVGDDFDENYDGPPVPLKCKSFDKNIVFLAPFEQENFCSVKSGWHPEAYSDYYQADKSYKFLILKGFNTKEIYLDKYESKDGNIFIFLAEYKDDTKDSVYQRKWFMEDKYGK